MAKLILLIFLIAPVMGCEGKVKLLGTKTVNAVLFSPMEGKILIDGKVASGAVIRRNIKLQGNVFLDDEFQSNESGEFSLPEVKKQLELSPLNQFVVNQYIVVELNGESYEMWYMGKLDTEKFSELQGQPINLTCDLTDDMRKVETPAGLLMTSCKWGSIQTST